MKKIKLYIANSLDGFIARPDGSLDWLDALPNPEQSDFGYYDFYNTIDTVIMGRLTYEEILGFDVPWPYPDRHTCVVTSQLDYKIQTDLTSVLPFDQVKNTKTLVQHGEKHIWLAGGGQLITEYLNHELVDEMIISIIPIILGDGIPLFPNKPKETNLKLIKSEAFSNGLLNLHYHKQ